MIPFFLKLFRNATHSALYSIGSLKKSFLLSLRSKETAVAISAFMILRSPRRFAFAKLLVMT